MSAEPVKLVIPGLGGSGPGHWQSLWSAGRPGWSRLEQRNWDAPVLGEWLGALEESVRAIDAPVVLVAHSLGAILVAHQSRRGALSRVTGALLVAPADVETPRNLRLLRDFAPIPTQRMPFPTWVVAGTNDPYCSHDRARALATAWGARFLSAGAAGHLNVASGHGRWPQGEHLLQQVVAAQTTRWPERRAG
jgi:predicted alpha/beta hydrolase family esterase